MIAFTAIIAAKNWTTVTTAATIATTVAVSTITVRATPLLMLQLLSLHR